MHGARLTVDLDAIAANWRLLAARHAAPTAAVVKADAYGLGAAQIVAALRRAGCATFFVAHLEEALAIRRRDPLVTLAVLNGLLPDTEGDYVAHGLLPVLGSGPEVARWSAAARSTGRRLPAMLHVDTGMNRLGFAPAAWTALTDDPAALCDIDVRFVMTHLVSAETPDDPVNQCQRARFAEARAKLPWVPCSLANSSGIFLGREFRSDLARPGAALYGVNPTPGQPNPMRPAVRLSARVLQVRDVGPGETVGYNGTWRAGARARIATASVGYADGWLRSQSGRGAAFFDGMAVPLVGRVSMDLATYDVTRAPALVAGDELELIGPNCPIDHVAEAAGTNGYEILTSLGRRYHRLYLGSQPTA